MEEGGKEVMDKNQTNLLFKSGIPWGDFQESGYRSPEPGKSKGKGGAWIRVVILLNSMEGLESRLEAEMARGSRNPNSSIQPNDHRRG